MKFNYYKSYIVLSTTLLILFGCQSAKERAIEQINQTRAAIAADSLSVQLDAQLIKAAINACQEYYKKFPDDSLATKYMYETANYYKAIKDYHNAFELWKKIYSEHPNSKQAPQSLFLSAFTYENELRNLQKGQELYTEFLNQYPDHELAASAEFSIKYLGLPAEEILKNFESKGKDSTASATETL